MPTNDTETLEVAYRALLHARACVVRAARTYAEEQTQTAFEELVAMLRAEEIANVAFVKGNG